MEKAFKFRFKQMPFVFKFSGFLLLLSFGAGQSWLHGSASQDAILSARQAVVSCPAVGRVPDMRTQWDVIRANDAVRVAWVSGMVGLSKGC
jgi:hypothetical protein